MVVKVVHYAMSNMMLSQNYVSMAKICHSVRYEIEREEARE